MSEVAIRAEGLSKVYARKVRALDELDLEVERGKVYGFLGRNGAGKSTTLRLFMGLLRPTRGQALIFGNPMWGAAREQLQDVAYVAQQTRLSPRWSLNAHSQYCSQLYPRWDASYARRLVDRFELPVDRPVGTLSGGQHRAAAVLLALAARPRVLLLDEPAAGLDPLARRHLMTSIGDILRESDDLTVLYSTHIVSDVEPVADTVGFLDKGRLVASGSLEELGKEARLVQIIFSGNEVPEDFAIPNSRDIEVRGAVLRCVVTRYDSDAVEALAARHQARVQTFPMGLENLFVEVFGGHAQDAKEEAAAKNAS